MTQQEALSIGFTLKSYKIEKVIEDTASHTTYLAIDTTLEQKVAIKEYFPKDLAYRDKEQEFSIHPKNKALQADYYWGLAKFINEAKILAKFQHHNILHINRFFKGYNTAYMVMNYEQGFSLAKLLEHHKTLHEEKIKQLFYPLLDALENMHMAGLLHRDITPAHILIRQNDASPVLTDFAAARQAIDGKSRPLTSIVSVGYAPPEQYDSKTKQGPWTDIYALGAILYQCISGYAPPESTRRLLRDDLEPAQLVGENKYSDELLNAIDLCLKVKPEKRPKNIKELKQILYQKPTVNIPKPIPEAKNNTLTIILWTIALILLFISGIFIGSIFLGN